MNRSAESRASKVPYASNSATSVVTLKLFVVSPIAHRFFDGMKTFPKINLSLSKLKYLQGEAYVFERFLKVGVASK